MHPYPVPALEPLTTTPLTVPAPCGIVKVATADLPVVFPPIRVSASADPAWQPFPSNALAPATITLMAPDPGATV